MDIDMLKDGSITIRGVYYCKEKSSYKTYVSHHKEWEILNMENPPKNEDVLAFSITKGKVKGKIIFAVFINGDNNKKTTRQDIYKWILFNYDHIRKEVSFIETPKDAIRMAYAYINDNWDEVRDYILSEKAHEFSKKQKENKITNLTKGLENLKGESSEEIQDFIDMYDRIDRIDFSRATGITIREETLENERLHEILMSYFNEKRKAFKVNEELREVKQINEALREELKIRIDQIVNLNKEVEEGKKLKKQISTLIGYRDSDNKKIDELNNLVVELRKGSYQKDDMIKRLVQERNNLARFIEERGLKPRKSSVTRLLRAEIGGLKERLEAARAESTDLCNVITRLNGKISELTDELELYKSENRSLKGGFTIKDNPIETDNTIKILSSILTNIAPDDNAMKDIEKGIDSIYNSMKIKETAPTDGEFTVKDKKDKAVSDTPLNVWIFYETLCALSILNDILLSENKQSKTTGGVDWDFIERW